MTFNGVHKTDVFVSYTYPNTRHQVFPSLKDRASYALLIHINLLMVFLQFCEQKGVKTSVLLTVTNQELTRI